MTIGTVMKPKKVNDLTVWNNYVKERTDDEEVITRVNDIILVIDSMVKYVKPELWYRVMRCEDAKDKCNWLINAIVKYQDGLITESELIELNGKISNFFAARIVMFKREEEKDKAVKRFRYAESVAFNCRQDLKKYIVKNFSIKKGE